MGQPLRRTNSEPESCSECPECRSSQTIVTLMSAQGAYCRCDACGYIWHQDSPPTLHARP